MNYSVQIRSGTHLNVAFLSFSGFYSLHLCENFFYFTKASNIMRGKESKKSIGNARTSILILLIISISSAASNGK